MYFKKNIKFNIIDSKTDLTNFFKSKSFKNVILPGGNTLNFILDSLINYRKSINIILTDERINFNKKKKLNSIKFLKIKKLNNKLNFLLDGEYISNAQIIEKFINQFKKLDKKKSLFLFGMGSDGHICSIFNNIQINTKFFISKKKNENFKRITISTNYINSFETFYLIGFGSKKGHLFNKILENNFISPIKKLKLTRLRIICDKSFYKQIKI